MPASRFLVTIPEGSPDRLDKALAREVPDDAGLSRSRLGRLIAEGAVSLAGNPVRDASLRPRPGDTYEIAVPAPDPGDLTAEDIPLSVVYEDPDLIVVDKPAGMVVHPAAGAPSGTLVNALLHHCGEALMAVGGSGRPGIVHRIDKDTSGLLVAAKTDRAHQGLSAQFAAHTVERSYIAFVHGVPSPADPRLTGLPGVDFEAGGVLRITTLIGRHPSDRQRQAVLKTGGRPATTRARIVETFGSPPAIARLECRLETGRTHQIRVHLAHVGHGLVGDPVYGGRRRPAASAVSPAAAQRVAAFGRQALHAATLGFTHPVGGKTMRFTAALPADMADLAAALAE